LLTPLSRPPALYEWYVLRHGSRGQARVERTAQNRGGIGRNLSREERDVDFDLDRFLAGLAALADEGTQHRYGAHPEQWAELRLPEGEPRGVAVILHGGFWRAPFTIATDLAGRGWATWNVEYRRIGAGGGVPETLEDVAAAVRVVPVTGSRVIAIGHSAGGQLALWLCQTGLLTAAVSLGGVCDLREGARLGIGDGAVAAFVGDADLALADPMQRLPTGVPQLLVHGDLDDRVPVELSRRYADAARAAGDRCELLELAGVGHFEPMDPRTQAWSQVVAALDRL
jgi:acetyl esterase/lipase